MHSLAERLLSHVRRHQFLGAGERVGVAVSGGIDSVALLRLLLEIRGALGIVLSVAHFNHKLRGADSDADEAFVAKLASEHQLDFHCESGDVARHAAEEHLSLETAARELRYGFFRGLLGEQQGDLGLAKTVPPLNNIVTGHTLDDQAETVLLRLVRGAGLRGLGGIHPRISIEDDDGEFCGEIVRPLLTTRRCDLEQYLKDVGQTWREDATNLSTKFTRNRVRKLLVPLLEKEFNPSVTQTLAELAEIARAEEDFWDNEVAGWMGTGIHWSEPSWAQKSDLVQIGRLGSSPVSSVSRADDLDSRIENTPWLVMNASVDRLWFLGEPAAVQRRVIKAVAEEAGIPLEFKHIQEILDFAAQERGSGGEIALPRGWKVTRDREQILFLTPDLRQPEADRDYEYDLPVPGEVNIVETGSTIEARRVLESEGYNPEHLLHRGAVPRVLKVRNWRAGDRFWPNHTKAPKKVKELLQERHVSQVERKHWPVIVSGDEIVWMRGFPVPANWAAKPGLEAIAILERPLDSDR